MIAVCTWLAAGAGMSLLVAPVGFRYFSAWRSRGVGFYRPLSLILIGFLFWIFGVLGLTRNSLGGLAAALAPAAAWSVRTLWLDREGAFFHWVRRNWKTIAVSEVVFLCGFALILLFRGTGPDISGTEKPMEMMFINGILRSETLPPADGWLGGYSISYYYFGYLMTTILIRLSGVPSEIGFNLMLATVFGMAAAGSFELIGELLRHGGDREKDCAPFKPGALLAPVFLLLLGNAEGLFESLHSLRLFWNADGTSAFWKWVGLKELTDAPIASATVDPTGRGGIWWWRASRVLQDIGLDGSTREVIDEFPFFSFYLGDLHPHVIAIPFVLLAIAVAWTGCRWAEKSGFEFSVKEGIAGAVSDWRWFVFREEFWLSALIVGAAIFINTWDFPFLFLLTVAGFAFGLRKNLFPFSAFLKTAVWAAIPFGAACIGFYGLFMEGLASQAGGILPSGVYTTRWLHLSIMFGAFLLPILIWLAARVRDSIPRSAKRTIFGWTGLILAFLLAVTTVLFWAMTRLSASAGSFRTIAKLFLDGQGATESVNPFVGFLIRRGETLATTLILAGMIAAALCLLTRGRTLSGPVDVELNGADRFIAMLCALAGALILFPEFFYLRDFFGTRMNTIFKFYYLAWILLSLSAAYAVNRLWRGIRGRAGCVAVRMALALFLLSAAVYPFWGITSKVGALGRRGLSLDGAAFVRAGRENDWATVEWLRTAPYGQIVEKVGGSYSADNVFSIFSGLPTVLGPMNHESQWRGGYAEIGSRNDDVRQIYESKDWRLVSELLDRYGVRYVVIGSAERSAYKVAERKFELNLTKVFESGTNRIYFVE